MPKIAIDTYHVYDSLDNRMGERDAFRPPAV